MLARDVRPSCRRDVRRKRASTYRNPACFNHSSVDRIVSRAVRNVTPSSRRAFLLSTNQYRVAYGTTCGLYGSRKGNAELVFELEQELEESQRVDPKLVDLGTF